MISLTLFVYVSTSDSQVVYSIYVNTGEYQYHYNIEVDYILIPIYLTLNRSYILN